MCNPCRHAPRALPGALRLWGVGALGLALVLLLHVDAVHAAGRRAADMLAPGAGPLEAGDRMPACLGGNATAPVARCEAALPRTAYVERALAHVWFRDFEAARDEAAAALSARTPGADAELFMARLLLTEFHSTNDRAALRSAREYAGQSMRSAGGSADKLATLGAIEDAAADWTAALLLFDEAIAIEPGHVFALHRRAVLLVAAERPRDALRDVDRLVERQPATASWYELRARLRADLDELQGAVSDYSRALELGGPQAACLLGRARANAALGNSQDGVRDFTALIEVSEGASFAVAGEELAELLQERAALSLRLGQGADAARDYLRSMEIGGARAVLALQLALNRLGWDIEADGVPSDELRRALSACLVNRRCHPAELQRA